MDRQSTPSPRLRARLHATLASAVALALVACLPIARAGDVGISINFAEPGVFGRVDIGRYPQPQVITEAPVIAVAPPVAPREPVEPIYLYVPREHQEHWREHCHEYHACDRPVHFVHHDWYREHVVNEEARRHERHEDRGREHDEPRGRDRD